MDGASLWVAILGAAGIGGIITAITNAWIASKKAPVEERNLRLNGNLTLVNAAETLVGSQSEVVKQRDAEIEKLEGRLDEMESIIEGFRAQMDEERKFHAAEVERLQANIVLLEGRLRSQSARIAALKRYLRTLGHDPDEVVPNGDEDEDEV